MQIKLVVVVVVVALVLNLVSNISISSKTLTELLFYSIDSTFYSIQSNFSHQKFVGNSIQNLFRSKKQPDCKFPGPG